MANIVYYSILNKMRQYVRLIKRHKFNAAAFLIIFLIFTPIFMDMFVVYYDLILYWFPYVLIIYSLIKIFQSNPIISVPFQIFELQLFTFRQLKWFIFYKISIASLFILALLLIFQLPVSPIMITALMTNILFNYLCFMKYQIRTLHWYIIMTVVIFTIALSIYLVNNLLLVFLFIFLCVQLFNLKFLFYDQLYPYYQEMGRMLEGLLNSDFTQISNAQFFFSKQASVSKFRFMENNYISDYLFYAAKEISRLQFFLKEYINISLLSFIIGFSSFMFITNPYAQISAMAVIILLLDYILTRLNKPEFITIKDGFYQPFNLKALIKQKYMIHSLIISVPLISGILIFKNISLWLMIILILVLPIKNIIYHYSNNWWINICIYVINGAIFSLGYFLLKM